MHSFLSCMEFTHLDKLLPWSIETSLKMRRESLIHLSEDRLSCIAPYELDLARERTHFKTVKTPQYIKT
jgi:hypothetical protein